MSNQGPPPTHAVELSQLTGFDDAEGPADRRQVFALLLRTTVGVVLGILALDLLLWSVDRQRDLRQEGLGLPDEDLGWTNRPGFENRITKISSIGLRSPEIPADAPSTEVRILGLGDSRVYGAGRGAPNMRETWSAYLEEMLNEEEPGDWRVLNAGVQGYSVPQVCRRAMRLLPVVEPDLVLIFASPSKQNMFDSSRERGMTQVGELGLPSDLARAWPEPLWPALAVAHGWLGYSALYTRHRTQTVHRGNVLADVPNYVLSRQARSPEVDAVFQVTLADMLACSESVVAAGGMIRGCIIPHKPMASPADWRKFLRRNQELGAPPLGTTLSEPIEVLSEILQDSGMPVWSLADVMSTIGADRARYTCDNTHWSAEGHRLVAEELLEKLRADGTLEALRARRARSPR